MKIFLCCGANSGRTFENVVVVMLKHFNKKRNLYSPFLSSIVFAVDAAICNQKWVYHHVVRTKPWKQRCSYYALARLIGSSDYHSIRLHYKIPRIRKVYTIGRLDSIFRQTIITTKLLKSTDGSKWLRQHQNYECARFGDISFRS